MVSSLSQSDVHDVFIIVVIAGLNGDVLAFALAFFQGIEQVVDVSFFESGDMSPGRAQDCARHSNWNWHIENQIRLALSAATIDP
jgi:hypothetical protein